MEKSAGILLIYNNKILLCHPTNAPWKGTYSIPKGKIEKGENNIEAAIRETKEEVGISLDKSIVRPETERVIEYRNKKGKLYKKVFYYPVLIENIEQEVIPKENLETREIDWAGFLDLESASDRIFWRFEPMLEFISK